MALISMPNPLPESVADTAMDVYNKSEYKARELSTRSITLFYTHARIARAIKNIPITRGRRQFTITGLVSTLAQDRFEDFLMVEATIDAMIAIIDIERRPNNDSFNDDHTESIGDNGNPDYTEFGSIDDNSDDDNDAVLIEKEDDGIADDKLIRSKLKTLAKKILEKKAEKTRVEENRLKSPGPTEMHRSKWEEARSDVTAIMKKIHLTEEILALEKEKESLRKRLRGGRTTARTARDKEKAKRCRRHLAQARENERVREERELHRPREAYEITVSVDINTEFEEGQGTYDLIVHYATTAMSWSPIYDMALSTTTNSGILYFDALLRNDTSETWDNCSFTLSTLDTNTASRNDSANKYSVPKLGEWIVPATAGRDIGSFHSMMYSKDDDALAVSGPTRPVFGNIFNAPRELRQGVFGRARGGNNGRSMTTRQATQRSGDKENISPENGGAGLGIFKDGNYLTEDDDLANNQTPSSQQTTSDYGGGNPDAGADAGTIPIPGVVNHEEPELALTYDLAGPTSLPRMKEERYQLDRITDIGVTFIRTAVPKHGTDVILQSELQNRSKSTLPPGPCGLTMDGKFLGRAKLPLWVPGRVISDELGPEPSIQVTYSTPVPEPDFKEWKNSERNVTFTRTITVANTQDEALGRPLQVTVIDQIPVSEHLEVTLVTPAGLKVNGPSVRTGESADDGAKNPWGEAEAKLKQGGQVEWTVTVNPGCATKLSLAYSCAFITVKDESSGGVV